MNELPRTSHLFGCQTLQGLFNDLWTYKHHRPYSLQVMFGERVPFYHTIII